MSRKSRSSGWHSCSAFRKSLIKIPARRPSCSVPLLFRRTSITRDCVTRKSECVDSFLGRRQTAELAERGRHVTNAPNSALESSIRKEKSTPNWSLIQVCKIKLCLHLTPAPCPAKILFNLKTTKTKLTDAGPRRLPVAASAVLQAGFMSLPR